ncbi:MAG: MATE family efflux transporter, partial [Bacteroidales bacterium]|nr:MATE family efflux transporter [Bacteroidales bacterium]
MIKTKELDNPALLGTAKISTLLAHYSFPAIVTMITASLYNIVDSIFIGHGVGPMALSGLAVSFPLMNVSAAFGSMVGVGAAALMSIKLGPKDMASAEKILGNMVILNVFVGVLVMAIGLIWLKPILILFGAGEENLPYAYDYMLVIILGNIFTHLYYGMNNALRTTGYPRAVMTVTIITIITNCILDALFIFVFKMGVFGAALATVIAQVVGLSISTSILRRPDAFVRLKRGIFSYKPRIAKEILTIGLPSFLLNLCACLAAIFLNNALKNISGDLSVGA